MCQKCGVAATGRRALLATALGALTMAGLAPQAGAQPVPRAADTPAAAFTRLGAGNARYAANTSIERDFSAGRAQRATGQAPYAAVLGCSDSRVAPELIFDEEPGNLFIVRVAGNFVTADGLASLEYGAGVLGTRAILVLGHTSCGAVNATIQALREGNTFPGNIAGLVTALKPGIEPALREGGSDVVRRVLEANVRHNVEALHTRSAVLSPLIQGGKLEVRGGVYDLATGQFAML